MMQEDEVGLGIFINYYGPISEGAIIAEHKPLGTIEETASLCEVLTPIRVHCPGGLVLLAACIYEEPTDNLFMVR